MLYSVVDLKAGHRRDTETEVGGFESHAAFAFTVNVDSWLGR